MREPDQPGTALDWTVRAFAPLTDVHTREADMVDRDQLPLLLQVARAYWIDDRSQADIAAEIGYSRSMVSRMLRQARELGIIRFTVGHPLERAFELEQALTDRFGLTQVRVSAEDAGQDVSDVSRLAAGLLGEAISPDCVLAITNGHSVPHVVHAMAPLHRPDATIVQSIGTIAQDNNSVDSPEICRQLAQHLKASYRLLPAPLVVRSPRVAVALRREEPVSMTLAMAGHADVMLTGIGATTRSHDGVIFDSYITAAEHDELLRAGSVGHICGHHIDEQGNHVDSRFCQRLLAVPFERLKGIQNVIAVAWGRSKAPAILGCLRGGLMSTLVTDVPTARAVLALAGD